MQIVAIRPEPGLATTIGAARELGIEVTGYPVSRIAPLDWTLPELAGIDALLIGSANALRYGGPQLRHLRHLPVLAVGKATAQVAESQGFSVEKVGEGGLQHVVDSLGTQPRHLLRLAGEAHVPLTPTANITIATEIVYRVEHLPLPQALQENLAAQCLVLLHSAGSAMHFACECDRLGLDRARISLVALGPRILAAAGEGWRMAKSAHRPDEAALLALTKDMCH
ncbi:uroporphyrinogen-III synthase [Altererythrobacter sp.]|uniref:uroporphyrinogen-III synthase n=1 Tax=Altererythrobacter sp. TaxID=1872480 RepID=UPI003D098EC1